MILKPILEKLYASRSQAHLTNDPLSFCHRFSTPEDQEIAGLIASSFAYGGVKIILRTLEKIFAVVGTSPRLYVERFSPKKELPRFDGFKHRFNDSRDLCALFLAARQMIEENGSVQSFFRQGYRSDAEDIGPALISYSQRVTAMNYSAVFDSPQPPANSYFPFFFPSPEGGSACKRLCMYLRWMVRPADGIDLGIWSEVSPSKLIIPVDTHIQKISRNLGLTTRKQADFRMAREITAALRRLDPNDPVKYDFSLCHLGISEGCSGAIGPACNECPVISVCMPEQR